jgi:hypothetical protein
MLNVQNPIADINDKYKWTKNKNKVPFMVVHYD